MLESFRVRSFRFQWGADAFATWASEMENLVLGWYVLVDTGSPFLVGLVGALRFGGTLLSPFYGVIADRFDRRRLLILLRFLHALQAAAIMALALSGTLQPWHAFAITGIGGLMRMAENVVRQSLIADVVPSSALMNAVGLSRTTMDVAKIAGAVAGAGLLDRLGIGPAYVVITGCFVLSTVLVFGVTPGRERSQSAAESASRGAPESPYRTLRSGLGYMRRSPTIVAIMFLAFLVNLTVFPLSNGLMPIVARDAFAFGPAGLALLLTAVSVGAVSGSLLLTALTARVRHPQRTMLIAIGVWHVLLLLFVWLTSVITGGVPLLPVALAVLAAYGAATSGSMV
ncbi:MAG TPA: MFS transporter, partial [Chloroflexota bacterium]|nr:MFS transporter [Chloroflexota bacterium]